MRAVIKGVYSAVIAAILLSGSAAMMGCETTKGAGKDLEKAGDKIQDAADK